VEVANRNIALAVVMVVANHAEVVTEEATEVVIARLVRQQAQQLVVKNLGAIVIWVTEVAALRVVVSAANAVANVGVAVVQVIKVVALVQDIKDAKQVYKYYKTDNSAMGYPFFFINFNSNDYLCSKNKK